MQTPSRKKNQKIDPAKDAAAFQALAGTTRFRLLEFLSASSLHCLNPSCCNLDEGCCDLSKIAEKLEVSIPTVSHHLKELRHAGLIEVKRRGRRIVCVLVRSRFRELADTLGRFTDRGKGS